MDILFVASELAPMVKVGGLADVVGALGKALRLLGHNVTIALPRFPGLEASGVMMARRLTPLSIEIGAGPPVEVTVFDGRLGSGVSLLVLDAPGLYDRPGVYGEGSEDYADNARRFAVFCRAVVEVVRQRAKSGTPFDVVHAHDWPTAPVPYLMRRGGAELTRSKTVLTIHNLTHQGVFPRDALALLGLDDSHFSPDALEFYGGVSFLKAGILSAHALTTVSNTYAREIQTPEHGERLDGVLRSRAAQLTGIVNGIDYAVWNPTTDPALAARYDAEDTSNKGRCKSALLVECGLPVAPERPVLAFVGRMAAQKGADVLAAALPKILRSDVSVVIAGAGDEPLADGLRQAVARAPERAVYLGGVAEAVVHRVLAGADAVLVPSRYEPCGLVQLYAQRYGALPVVTRTGGLVDTVVDIDAALETGTGVLIDEATPAALLGGVQRAVAAMHHPRWPALRRRIMRLDLGWDRPARRYAQLYRNV
jgi:starch synthase